MRDVTLLCATRGRPEKLGRMLASVPVNVPWLRVLIVHDGDVGSEPPVGEPALRFGATLEEIWTGRHVGAVAARNLGIAAIPPDRDVLYATDDVEFLSGAFERAGRMLAGRFPDGDGVVGLEQASAHHPAGVALVGARFLDRYPGRRLFNPDYWHFACQEVGRLAESLGRFAVAYGPLVIHHHPGCEHNEMDQTHVEARVRREADLALSARRQHDGDVWGA